eukprot:gnl/MRDRNA2_/MRDRNA2_103169_c0_seq1.p1 gnl/MRDRNA2_/MRDRNA2_103169_c0~~gnl/MRDRNA2_/MRDRNA2_103169_c0_seq1.p1  ORF type:complete len:465 (+),score=66.25 gnl/MRDRNA2_/MRDRNA2_103169_c0_seq1:94-1488(+)
MQCLALLVILARHAAGSLVARNKYNQEWFSAATSSHGVSLMQKRTGRKVHARVKADDGERASSEEPDAFVLTWEVPTVLQASSGMSILESQHNLKRWINVTALEARQMTGPLTVLLALRICEGATVLSPIFEKARGRGKIHIHLLGVQDKIEPQMAWKRFLVGPLTDRDRHLLDVFGLPHTPLAGVNVSLLFNGNEFDSTATKQRGVFTEMHKVGLYHQAVKEVPDLAIALNPGFPHYLGNWWPTLRRLWHSQVPILATGYGHSFGTGFAVPALYNLGYDSNGRTKSTPLLATQEPVAQTLPDSNSNARCANSTAFVGLPKKDPTVCSDREGNALVADHAGFAVQVEIRNPFVFCSPPGTSTSTSVNCQGSEVLSLFRPTSDVLASKSNLDTHRKKDREEIPSMLASQIMQRSLTCTPFFKENRRCIERHLQKIGKKPLPRKARVWIDEYLLDITETCEEEQQE